MYAARGPTAREATGEDPVAVAAQLAEEAVGLAVDAGVHRLHAPVDGHAGARGEHALGRALDDEQPLALALDHHRDPAPLEVEGHLVDAPVAGDVGVLVAEDRVVHGRAQARLVGAVERGEPDHRLVVLAPQVHVPVDGDLPEREGPRLVAAEHVHAAEVLDGGQPLHDDLPPGHAHRAARQRDRHDHGQELGREPHRERHREEEGLERVAAEEGVDEEDEEHEEEHDLEDQEAKAAGAALELGVGRPGVEPRGHAPELRAGSRGHHDRGADAADHGGAVEDGARRVGGARLLLGGERLARQRALVQEEVLGREQAPVRRHEVPGGELDDVAGHDLPRRDLANGAVPAHGGDLAHALAEAGGRALGAVGLREVEGDAEHEHQRDDDRADDLPEGGGDRAGEEEDQHERVGQVAEQLEERREAAGRRQFVRAVAREPLGGLRGR